MNTKVIYTCLTGGYDKLLQPKVIDNHFDYICFTNDQYENNVGIWQIRQMHIATDNNTILSRYPKILPHKFLAEYEYSIYMDANIQIIDQNFYDTLNKYISEGVLIAQVPHLERDCIYEDIKAAYYYHKISFISACRQYKYYKSLNYPEHNGLYENNLILRNHNSEIVKEISCCWWNEYVKFSKRDQFSLKFVYWEKSFSPVLLFGEDINVRNSNFLRFNPSHGDKKSKILHRVKMKLHKAIAIVMCIFLR